MSNLQVKDVPEALHTELRRRAEQAGMSLRDYVLDVLRREAAGPSRLDWLEEVRSLSPAAPGPSAAELIRQEREARAAGAGRR